jgi:hypothetical protein
MTLKGRRYRVVQCPYCNRRVRVWDDGRVSRHYYLADVPCEVRYWPSAAPKKEQDRQ